MDREKFDSSSGARVSFSTEMWGINWQEHFPKSFPRTGITADVCNQEDAFEFLQQYYLEVFGRKPEHGDTLSTNKKAYYYRMGDSFALYKDEEKIRVIIFTPEDWNTYYMRIMAVREEFRRGGATLFTKYMLEILSKNDDVTRVTCDTSPANHSGVNGLNRLGFIITGNSLDNRWGPLTRFTKYLDKDEENNFKDTFVSLPVNEREN